MTKLPDFIIIGAMKCATSTLHEQLALQKGIFMTDLKEPNFFSNDEEYEKGMEWYYSHFQSALPDDLAGESSTHYTKLPTYPQTIERIQAHLPHAKFIYVMRHPIDRLVSQYIHEWTQKVINIDINQAIDQYPELIAYSQYTMQMKPYFEVFSPQQVLPVFFERFLKQPQVELARICQFIGYEHQPQWQELEAVNASDARLRKSAWRDFLVEAPLLKEFRRNIIPKSFRDYVKSFWRMKDKPQLEASKIEYLESIFDQDLQTLGDWFGVELNCHNFKETIANNSSLEWDRVKKVN